MLLDSQQVDDALLICDDIIKELDSRGITGKAPDPKQTAELLQKLQKTVGSETPAEFAKHANIPWVTFHRWVGGNHVPRRSYIDAIRKIIKEGNWGAPAAKHRLRFRVWYDVERRSNDPIKRIWIFSWDPFLDWEDERVFAETKKLITTHEDCPTLCYVFAPESPAERSFIKLADRLENETDPDKTPGRVVGFRIRGFHRVAPLFAVGIRFVIWEGQRAPGATLGELLDGGLVFRSEEKYVEVTQQPVNETPLVWMSDDELRDLWAKECCTHLASVLGRAKDPIPTSGVITNPIDIH